jgi:heat shock protein HslJ
VVSHRSIILAFAVCAITLGACKSSSKNDPRNLMMGEPPVEWRLVTMYGAPVDSAKAVTLQLAKDGGFSGGSFVNRYFGTSKAGADGTIAFGQIGSTMMAASPELMNLEQQYFKLLEQVDGFSVAGDTLTLKHGDAALLEFVRQPK